MNNLSTVDAEHLIALHRLGMSLHAMPHSRMSHDPWPRPRAGETLLTVYARAVHPGDHVYMKCTVASWSEFWNTVPGHHRKDHTASWEVRFAVRTHEREGSK